MRVGKGFACEKNKLSTLEGCATYIGGNLDGSWNDLISTYAGDIDIEIGGYFFYKLY